MGGYDQLKSRTRADYPYFLEYRTRWYDATVLRKAPIRG